MELYSCGLIKCHVVFFKSVLANKGIPLRLLCFWCKHLWWWLEVTKFLFSANLSILWFILCKRTTCNSATRAINQLRDMSYQF